MLVEAEESPLALLAWSGEVGRWRWGAFVHLLDSVASTVTLSLARDTLNWLMGDKP